MRRRTESQKLRLLEQEVPRWQRFLNDPSTRSLGNQVVFLIAGKGSAIACWRITHVRVPCVDGVRPQVAVIRKRHSMIGKGYFVRARQELA